MLQKVSTNCKKLLDVELRTVSEEWVSSGRAYNHVACTDRWLVLLLSSLVTFGSYYVFDNPSALHDQLKQSLHGSCSSNTFELYFNLFYTVCSVPNVLLPAFGGYYVDKIGMRLMVVIYAFIVLVGQIVVSIGVSTRSMQLVLLGRFLFGLGGESLTVGTSALVSAWFVNQELVLPRQFAMLTSQPLSDWFL